MKPMIKVWCLPADQTEEDLNKLHRTIVSTLVGVPELELKGEGDMVCLFPPDLMKYGLGEEIPIEVTRLHVFEGAGRRSTRVVRWRLARMLEKNIIALYPKACVECTVEGLDLSDDVGL